MRQRILMVMLFSLAVLTSGCAHRVTGVEGREFSNPAEALAHLQSVNEQKLRQVEPLPAPVAGLANMAVPTQSYFDSLAQTNYPDMNAEKASQFARLIEENAMLLPRMIQRRAIFQTVKIVRSNIPSAELVPANGHMVFLEYIFLAGQNTSRVTMATAGDPEMRVLLLKRSPTSEDEMRMLFLGAIEDYVKAHPAGT